MFVAPLGSSGTPFASVTDAVTLTGATINATGNGYVLAQLWIAIGGNVFKYESPTGTSQLGVGTDWVKPDTSPNPLYEVRFLNFVTTGPAAQTGGLQGVVEGVWETVLPLGRGVFCFTADQAKPTTLTLDVEIRLDGGPVLATASYTLKATRS